MHRMMEEEFVSDAIVTLPRVIGEIEMYIYIYVIISDAW